MEVTMAEWRRWLVGLGTVLSIIMLEIKDTWLITQLFTTAGSMLVSLVVYAYAFGWQFAMGFIFLLLAHEWGHVIAIRSMGLGVRGPLFIPFLGAVVQLQRPPRNVKADAGIALAGPALGTMSALFCLIMYLWVETKVWLVLAYTGFILNLFNLIPCSPLDGGRIAPAISSRFWIIGLVVLGLIFLKTLNPFLLVILLFAVFRAKGAGKEEWSHEYFFVTPLTRIKIGVWYFSILSILGIATIFTHQLLK
jgi:Zn-dependent protease